MKRIIAALLLLGVWCVRGASIPAAERLLPADTLGFLTVPNWRLAQTNFSQASLGQLFADPAMKAFKEKFITKLQAARFSALEKELGIKVSDYTDLVQGQLTLAITRNGWTGEKDTKPGFLWVIDTRDKSSQLKTNLTDLRKKWVEAGKRLRTDKIRDVEFTTLIVPSPEPARSEEASDDAGSAAAKPVKPMELLVGQSESLLILSDSAKDVEKVLALQSGSSVPALAEQASFAPNARLLRDAAFFAWADVKTIMATLSRKRPEARGQAPSLFGAPPSIERILQSIGLSGVQTVAINGLSSSEGSLFNFVINVPETGRKGMVKIFAVDPKDASPPPFVPGDAVKFQRWRIDLQKAWSSLENMMAEISPASAGVFKLLLDSAGKDKDPNFDLRKELLGNLGDDIISYEKAARPGDDPASPPSLTLVGAKNAGQLAASLKAITSIIPPDLAKYSERDFLGRKVYSFTWPSMGSGKSTPIHYAASGGYVALSSDVALVEEYLRSNEGTGKSLRETAGLNEAAQKVGGMSSGFFSFENQNASMRSTFEAAKKDPGALLSSLGTLQALVGLTSSSSQTNGLAEWLDASKLPAYDVVSKYFHMEVSAVNVSPDTITFRMFAPTPPQLHK